MHKLMFQQVAGVPRVITWLMFIVSHIHIGPELC